MAAYTELYMDQGATFNRIISIGNDITNANINVAGYTITSQMRRSYYSANATANLVCTVTDEANGEISLTMDAANTAAIKHGRYLFDVEMEDTDGNVIRILEGLMIVTPEITK